MARRKLWLLVLSLAVLAGSLAAPRVQAEGEGGGSCTFCTTEPDGRVCCQHCSCPGSGLPIACTNSIWCYYPSESED